MRLLNQACEALIQKYSDNPSEYINLMYQHIERCGRTCYRSSDKITEDSAKPFVERMIKSNHTAMLEHGTVYLTRRLRTDDIEGKRWVSKYFLNKYSRHKSNLIESDYVPLDKQRIGESVQGVFDIYITTNLRVIVENHWEDDLKYVCEPTGYHEKRYTLLCTTALHCYKDLTRHRVFSFAIESTRYCNYSKDKFGGELSFIIPTWCEIPAGDYPCHFDDEANFILEGTSFGELDIRGANKIFMLHCGLAEHDYKTLIEYEWQAQQAAEVLPQCIKGDMIITGFEDDWKHLLDLRYYGTTGAPHPMVKELATLMKEELEKLGFNY